MRFGKIEFLNLLPFDMFIKSYPLPSRFKQSLFAKSSYPAKLNQSFLFNRIDAGFISSIAGVESHRKLNGKYATKSGIIAKGAVWSVLVRHASLKADFQSDTSNALSKVLNLKGEVLIGDKALLWLYKNFYQNLQDLQNPQHLQNLPTKQDFTKKDFKPKSKISQQWISNATQTNSTHANPTSYTDMGKQWFKKTRLPFVFGRLCCVKKYATFYAKISHSFNASHIKIPHFWLVKQSKKIGIPPSFVKEYLKHIYYKIDTKEHLGILRFFRSLRLLGIKPPKRNYKKAQKYQRTK
ncbi:MqnA/MqnD/SBP family protein [Helicobacter sp. T3_23-1059]